jgi:hypothetical protein
LLPDQSTPLILLKANVCRLLERQLSIDGFNVLNSGRVVYFPSTGRQKEFHRQFRAILKSANVITGLQHELAATNEMADQRYVTAPEIANDYRLNPKTYRQALRNQARHDPRLSFHERNQSWRVPKGSSAYDAMIEVAKR